MSKTKRRAVAASTFGAVVVAVLFSWGVLHSPPTPIDIAQELQQIVSDAVAKDPSVKNCVLSVMKGDGSHDWHALQFPLQYGYGTMYFKFPWTKLKPFLLMRQVMRAIESRQRAQVGLSGNTGAAGSQ